MSFLNDHIKRRKSYTNVSNLKRPKNVEVTENKAHSHVSSATALRCTDTPHKSDEYDQSTTSSMFSLKESTPSPAPTIPQATPLRRPLTKKKNDLTGLENSLVTLCQTMHQRLQSNRNPDIAGNSDETFARLIVNQLETLPSHEKQKRQQTIIQILYEPYDPNRRKSN
ncbi:uncharacterized protein [Temnothorax nylanderi]|uniref:uncharacterized protein n=1 Tax=Temnothorax nylanderi TaxID=102681 RepID=UPI003A8748EE